MSSPRFSIDLSTRKGIPVHEQIRLAAGAGFSHVSVGTSLFADVINPAGRETLFGKIRTYGLGIDWLHVPFATLPSLYHEEPEARAITVAAVSRLLTCVAGRGVGAVVMHPVSFPVTQARFDFGKTAALVIEGIRQLAAHAEECGVVFAVENQDNLKREPYARAVLDALPNVFLCYDSGHAHLTGTRDLYLPKYAHRLAAVHFHDNNGQRDNHALPGDGTVDWPGVLSRMEGYAGVYGLETQSPSFLGWHGPVEDFFKEAYRRLKGIVTENTDIA